MVFGSADANKVELLAEELLMRQHLDMNLFTITEYHLVNMGFPEKGAKMEVKFRRKITSEMMTTYLPSVLLMMTTYATTFFKPFFFEAALSVNLTTMLVMTTIFISKMESLPPTSDIKMIDIWLILCQLVPFLQVVLRTAFEYAREEEQDGMEEKRKGGKIVSTGRNKKGNPVVGQFDFEPKQRAWIPVLRKGKVINSVQILTMIGKFVYFRCQSNKTQIIEHIFQRKGCFLGQY